MPLFEHTIMSSPCFRQRSICDRTISWGVWPLHSPDLNLYYLNLWNMLQETLYSHNPYIAQYLKTSIQEIASSIAPAKQSVMHVFARSDDGL